MKELNLYAGDSPISDAVLENGILSAVCVPEYEDGTIEQGDIRAQADLTFRNLAKVLEMAGGSMKDVVQVIVFLCDMSDKAGMNEVWKTYFPDTRPNRATIGINALGEPGMKIEIAVTAILDKQE
ncbi:UNVERIFIED_CONTAM: 2-iminobutanoate/2-iminopropanoate deaminase [Brevibacillus sp. OAP136]